MTQDNDSTISNDGSLAGDPTETAMIQFGFDHGYDVREKLKDYPRVGEIPISIPDVRCPLPFTKPLPQNTRNMASMSS